MIPPAAADRIDIAHFFSSAWALADHTVLTQSQTINRTNPTASRNTRTSLNSRTLRSRVASLGSN
jgi:hypothetical protein